LTTGSSGSYTNLILTVGAYEYKSWNGVDGKYGPLVGGHRDLKWNPYSMRHSQRDRRAVRAYFQRKDAGDPNDYTDYVYLSIAGPEPEYLAWPHWLEWSNNDKLDVMSKLIERVKSHDFNLAVNVAQGRQLVDMVALNLRKFGRSITALKRGRFDVAARELTGASPKKNSQLKVTDISGRWLELQYGWLPALSDTFEAAKAFEAISNGPRKRTFSAAKKRGVSKDGLTDNGVVTWWWSTLGNYRIKFELAEEMSVNRQLGLLDPLSVAWEVVPYSFVVDWFLPIGQYLSVLSQIPFMKGRFLITERRSRTGPSMAWSNPHEPFVVGQISLPSDDYGTFKSIERSFHDELAVPLPNFVDGLTGSPKRIANAIALAHQAFARPSGGFTSRGGSL